MEVIGLIIASCRMLLGLLLGESIPVRNPSATRPWQHVIEPLGGYLRLAEALALDIVPPCESFNFGPKLGSNKTVRELIFYNT